MQVAAGMVAGSQHIVHLLVEEIDGGAARCGLMTLDSISSLTGVRREELSRRLVCKSMAVKLREARFRSNASEGSSHACEGVTAGDLPMAGGAQPCFDEAGIGTGHHELGLIRPAQADRDGQDR